MNHYVFFTRTLPFHSVGGMEVLTWSLMTEIVRNGSEKVTVVTTTIPGKPSSFESEGVAIVAISGVTPRRYTPTWWKLSANYFDNHLRNDCCCVVSVAMGAAGLLFQRKRFHDVPIICQSHGTVLSEIISKLRTRNPVQILKCLRQIKYFVREYRVYKHADRLVAAGGIVDATLRRFPYSLYLHPDKITLIENGINTKNFCASLENRVMFRERYAIPMEVPLIVSVARLIKQKGVAQAVYAFKELLRTVNHAHLMIVGDGEEKAALEALVKTLDLGDKVTFVGAVDYAQLPEYYQMSDVIIFPTLRMEGSPLNMLEALSVGLPVVASSFLTHSSRISEFIQFVDPRDSEKLARAIADAIDLAKNNRITLPEEHSLPKMSQKYLYLFKK